MYKELPMCSAPGDSNWTIYALVLLGEKDIVFAIHYVPKEVVNTVSMLWSKYVKGQKSNVIAKEDMGDESLTCIKPYPGTTQEDLSTSVQPSGLHQ